MKKFLVMIAAAMVVGCGATKEVVDIYKGDIGPQGPAGVSSICSIEQSEEGNLLTCSNGDSALITSGRDGRDGNDGVSCSVSDTEGGALIACGDTFADLFDGNDGTNGTNGTNGTGSLSVVDYAANSCTAIAGTAYYVKKTGSNNFAIYTASNCASSSKQFEVAQGEAHTLATKILALWNVNGLRVYNFN